MVRNQIKLWLISSPLILLISCNSRKSLDFFVISDSKGVLDTLPIHSVRKDTFSGRAQTIAYYTEDDTIGFFVRVDNLAPSETTWGVENIELSPISESSNEIIHTPNNVARRGLKPDLTLIDSNSVVLDGKTEKVYQYRQEGHDGNSFFYFWSPEFGIFCRYARTNPEFAVLQSRDKTRNRKITMLLHTVKPMNHQKLKDFIH